MDVFGETSLKFLVFSSGIIYFKFCFCVIPRIFTNLFRKELIPFSDKNLYS